MFSWARLEGNTYYVNCKELKKKKRERERQGAGGRGIGGAGVGVGGCQCDTRSLAEGVCEENV